jgi:hypothetical protein
MMAPSGLTPNASYTLTLQSDQNPGMSKSIAVMAVASTPYKLMTFYNGGSSSWRVGNSLQVSWTGSGTATAGQTASIWIQFPGLAPTPLMQKIPILAPGINLPSPNIAATTTAALYLVNDSDASQVLPPLQVKLFKVPTTAAAATASH